MVGNSSCRGCRYCNPSEGQVAIPHNSSQSLVKPKTLRLMMGVKVSSNGDCVKFIHGKKQLLTIDVGQLGNQVFGFG